MSRITTTVALLLMATAACGQAKEDAGDGKQLDKQTMETVDRAIVISFGIQYLESLVK